MTLTELSALVKARVRGISSDQALAYTTEAYDFVLTLLPEIASCGDTDVSTITLVEGQQDYPLASNFAQISEVVYLGDGSKSVPVQMVEIADMVGNSVSSFRLEEISEVSQVTFIGDKDGSQILRLNGVAGSSLDGDTLNVYGTVKGSVGATVISPMLSNHWSILDIASARAAIDQGRNEATLWMASGQALLQLERMLHASRQYPYSSNPSRDANKRY